MATQEATYHLGYELDDEQPVISVHAHPSYFRSWQHHPNIEAIQQHFGLGQFTHDADSFGYDGVGRMQESSRAAGWTALRMALPKGEPGSSYLGDPTERLLPIVTTFSFALGHLKWSSLGLSRYRTDPESFQLLTASVYNRRPFNAPDSAYLRAHLTPELLEVLSEVDDIAIAEKRVRQALTQSFLWPYPAGERYEDRFAVNLGEAISFNYPGDGTGFFGRRTDQAAKEGLTINAYNNDYPLQQIAILGGLAALNDVAFEQWNA